MHEEQKPSVLMCYFRHGPQSPILWKCSHPMMLTSKKKTEILELLFLSDSLFSMMECYQGEEWFKDRLLEREEKVELVIIFF